MRVAVVHSFYSGALASGENQVVEDQVRELAKAGIEVCLIGPETDELRESRGYKIRTGVNVITRRGTDPHQELALWEPDVVHIHNTFPNLATRWLPKWRGPVVLSFHNYRVVCSNGTLFRSGEICRDCVGGRTGPLPAVAHACYRNSRSFTIPVAFSRRGFSRDISSGNVVGISTSAGSHGILADFVPPGVPMVMVPNFVQERLQTRHSVSRHGWLAVGRLSPEKGFASLVRDWPNEHHLLVVGDGSDYNRIAREAENRPNVTLQRTVSRDELRKLMDRHIGLVFPSLWYEVAPQVVAEAMCAGLPVLAHTQSVVARVVDSAGAGATYSDPWGLSQGLSRISAARAQMSQAAREYYEANLTPAAWLKKMLTLYEVSQREFRQRGNLSGMIGPYG